MNTEHCKDHAQSAETAATESVHAKIAAINDDPTARRTLPTLAVVPVCFLNLN